MKKENKKEYMKIYNKLYSKSEIGVLKKLYHHMKERSIKNNWKFTILYDDFVIWAYKNKFRRLFNFWKKTQYDKLQKPSIDRINDYGVYEFSNMKITTLWDLRKYHKGLTFSYYEDVNGGLPK